MTSYLYFIEAPHAGHIKIGVTRDPAKRLGQLIGASPVWLVFLKVIHGTRTDERRWHKKWAHLRIHGEWFLGDESLRHAIDALVGLPMYCPLDTPPNKRRIRPGRAATRLMKKWSKVA